MAEKMDGPFESLSNYVHYFDSGMVELERLVDELEVIESKIRGKLSGGTPEIAPTKDPGNTVLPSLGSSKERLDLQLKELGQVVKALDQCVTPIEKEGVRPQMM